ncbi:MAG: hypothetical protein P4L03_00900, partial [Terracidiphilus sp.]|nr:hypothetical protein [Terracidiphilus sp.]
MQRLRTVITLALACCLFSTSRPAFAQQPSSTFSIELRFANPAMREPPGILLIVKIGEHESRTSPIGAWSLSDLTQSIESWREAATDILFKTLHM